MDSIENLVLEISLMVTSFAIQFFLPGFAGLFFSGLLSLGASIGVQISHNNLTQNPMFYINRLLSIFLPQAKKLIFGKVPILATANQILDTTNKILAKAQNIFMDDFIKALRDPKNVFKANGLTENLENDIKKMHLQDKLQEALGKDVVKTEPYYRYAANTKNPDSWIMSIDFQELVKIGKKRIGDMTITYCFGNEHRVGFRLVPIKGQEILYGRTSQGKINHRIEQANKTRYRKVACKIDKSKYRLVRATFNNCSFYGDFLPFLRAFSWGGYYMRKWMIGMPGKKDDIIAPFLFLGSLSRLYSRLTAIVKTVKNMEREPGVWWSKKVRQLGVKYVLSTKIGSKMKIAKATKIFSKANDLYKNPVLFTSKQAQNYALKVRKKILQNRRKKKGK